MLLFAQIAGTLNICVPSLALLSEVQLSPWRYGTKQNFHNQETVKSDELGRNLTKSYYRSSVGEPNSVLEPLKAKGRKCSRCVLL